MRNFVAVEYKGEKGVKLMNLRVETDQKSHNDMGSQLGIKIQQEEHKEN